MKRRLLFFISVILVVTALIFCVPTFFRKKVEVSGNFVENGYNNQLSRSNFLRINDVLYYFYSTDSFGGGLYKISNQNTERIFAPRDFKGVAYPIRSYNQELSIFRWKEPLYSYNSEKNEIISSFEKSHIAKIGYDFQITEFGTVYAKKDRFSSCYALTLQTSDGEKDLVNLKNENAFIEGYYVSGDRLYYKAVYPNEISSLSSNHLRAYHFKENSDDFVYDFGESGCGLFLIESNHLIYNQTYGGICSLYFIDLNKSVLKAEKFFEETDTIEFNAYNGKVYIPTSTGVLCYDLQSKKIFKLCDHSSNHCYIVDDYWVYFTDEKDTLWRVAQNGSELEKVFG